jgi:hypothetical protein
MGAVIPSFGDYFYYFMMDVTGFSKFTYAMLGVLGSATLLFGTFVYNFYLTDKSLRFMMVIACLINFVGAVNSLLFVKEIYFGLSPLVFVILSSTVADTLYTAFVTMPGMIVFAKLIPPNIESSMFSMLMGLLNFCNIFVSKMLGNFINRFFGVTEDNLEDLWQLYVTQIVLCLVPIFFICLLPTRIQVANV